ncbi:MAG: redox-regulated ATPase YchF [Peptococcaceae bacterium]|nr:redox-regulated ATPase YchF [Peptococcaceae bacterium]
MPLHLGLIGLPNVGKTLLFNAMTKTDTDTPLSHAAKKTHIGIVNVPDSRLHGLAKIVHPDKIVSATVEFVDIAGLGRSDGKPHDSKTPARGNPFLSDIRGADALIHVVRCFDDENVFHINSSVNPTRDIESIRLELILADLESLERRKLKLSAMIKGGDKSSKHESELLDVLSEAFYSGKTAALAGMQAGFTTEDIALLKKNIDFLSWKPIIYVANIAESALANPSGNNYCREVFAAATEEDAEALAISALLESDLAAFTEQERREYFSALSIQETDLDRLIQRAFDLLGLMTFFTAGPKEVKAWTIRKNTKAPHAAGVIHSDIERGFIKADVITYEHYIACGGEKGAREKGLFRLEGKDYLMRDGDVVNFRFNV